jgi:hypothetical protein
VTDDCGWRERHDESLEAKITEFGWTITVVAPSVADTAGTIWGYTIGVEDKGGPEFLMMGLPARLMQTFLNQVVRECLHRGSWWEDGDRIPGVVVGYELLAVRVPDDVALAGTWFNVAKRRRRLRGVTTPLYALQLVWPDDAGDYHDTEIQTILGWEM